MVKKAVKKTITIDTLAKTIDTLAKNVTDGFLSVNKRIDSLEKNVDIKITRLESYMRQGFETLNDKIDTADERLSYHVEGLGRRIDDIADNKISKMEHRALEKRVVHLEQKVGISKK